MHIGYFRVMIQPKDSKKYYGYFRIENFFESMLSEGEVHFWWREFTKIPEVIMYHLGDWSGYLYTPQHPEVATIEVTQITQVEFVAEMI